MLARAQELSRTFAEEERIEVDWERIWIDRADPLRRDADRLRRRGDPRGRRHVAPAPLRPLHDAAEVARAGVPTVMLFVQSLRGLSHTKLEDTKPEHLELAVAALDRLAAKTIAHVAAA
jgi:N-carbamoyl-L-amino-acid hydrolase